MKEKWNKENILYIIENSNTYTQVLKKLKLRTAGSNYETLKKYINLYDIDISHFKLFGSNSHFCKKFTLNEILIEKSNYSNRTFLKERLYKEGYKERKCELCGQDENWNNMKISLILDHKNGVYNDHRLENLRIVCPNCNAGLETHCGKNVTYEKKEKIREKYKSSLTDKQIDRFLNLRKTKRPEYDILINCVKSIGFSATGKLYGVSDNSIRKWIKTYEKYKI